MPRNLNAILKALPDQGPRMRLDCLQFNDQIPYNDCITIGTFVNVLTANKDIHDYKSM